jgi:hypothetical protein
MTKATTHNNDKKRYMKNHMVLTVNFGHLAMSLSSVLALI